MHHYQITVSGKVQGVWFRKSTQDKARELGLRGFVRNQPDGSVYIEASG
jgi:acylphosphatase